MKLSTLSGLTLIYWMAACAPVPEPQALVLPCPASATAEVEVEPVAPALDAAQRLAVDVAIVQAVGPVLGSAVIRFTDVDHPAWGRRQAARVEMTKAACEARSTSR